MLPESFASQVGKNPISAPIPSRETPTPPAFVQTLHTKIAPNDIIFSETDFASQVGRNLNSPIAPTPEIRQADVLPEPKSPAMLKPAPLEEEFHIDKCTFFTDQDKDPDPVAASTQTDPVNPVSDPWPPPPKPGQSPMSCGLTPGHTSNQNSDVFRDPKADRDHGTRNSEPEADSDHGNLKPYHLSPDKLNPGTPTGPRKGTKRTCTDEGHPKAPPKAPPKSVLHARSQHTYADPAA
jgi:hypothetical protein